MSNRISIFFKYFLLFIFLFLFNYFFNYHLSSGDSFNCFGFSYAIRIGEIPYRDFNILVPPLYPFIMSLGLFIWNNHLMFVIEHSIIILVMFYLLDKIYSKKILLVFSSLFSLGCFCLSATYNFFVIFFLIFIIHLEKNKSHYDFLIGFIIGLAILSKHTVGLFFIIPSIIFYYNDYKRLLLRFLGIMIPCIIFFFYLIFSKTLNDFINLCFLGIFDFGSSNSHFSIFLFLSIIVVLIILILIYKDRKNITNYYIFFTCLFVVPIFDLFHFTLFFFCFILLLAQYINNKHVEILWIFINFMYLFLFCIPVISHKMVRVNSFNHLNYMSFDENFSKRLISDFKYIDLYDDPILLSYDAVYYEVSHDKAFDNYSIFNNGNYGYDGINKMIDNIKNEHGRYVIIKKSDYQYGKDGLTQFSSDICDYIMDNYKKVDENDNYYVYYID